jgi:uncharacterized protein YjdB
MIKFIRFYLSVLILFASINFSFTQTCSITGNTFVCIGSTLNLTGSGTPAATNPWSSSNTALATVSSTGVVNGINPGTITITYTTSTGCVATKTVSIRIVPVMTSANSATICSGNSFNLNLTNSLGSNGFVWSAANNPNVTGESTTNQTTSSINNNLYHIISTNLFYHRLSFY